MSSEILELGRSDRNCDDRDDRINGRLDESLELAIMTNVDSRKRSNEGDRAHGRSKAPSKSSTKDKEQHGVERNSYSDKIKDEREVGANDKLRKRSSSRHTSSKDYSNGKRDKLMYKDRRDRRGEDHERRRESGRDWDREHKKANDRGRSRDRNYAIIPSYRDMNVDREKYGESERDRARDSYRRRGRHDDEPDRSTRYHKYDDQDDGHGGEDLHHGYGKLEYINDRTRNYKFEKNQASKDVYVQEIEEANRDDDDQKEYQDRVELKLAEQEEDDIDRIKEESRKIREAILQKYKVKQSQQLVVLQEAKDESDEQLKENSSQESSLTNAIQEKTCEIKNGKEAFVAAKLFNVEKSPLAAAESSMGAVGLGEGSPKSERANDMFCDDIFGDSPAGIRKTGKRDGSNIEGSGLRDNWDDPEGYYSFRYGEVLDSRYEVIAAHGKGVFSTVVRAKDLKAGGSDPEEVAIKIIRNNEIMLKAGTEELVILKKLVDADPGDKRHCVRYLSHFKYRNHLCIVFESLHMNLREVLKKFGRNIGLKLTAVRAYAKQLIIALKHLTNCGVLHCDIKPDNMLVNDAKILLKLCDFGNAMLAGKNEITPYLVSRFYRAPEIILGLPYDHPVDMWSVGCCLYELYTGKVLFPGATNNDMLRLHMELKGSFPKKMLRKGAFVEPHFDQDLNFLATDEDPVTKKATRRLICNIRPKDIGIIVKGSGGEDLKMLANFKDLLDKIFILDPDKRLSVSQALNHPFIAGK